MKKNRQIEKMNDREWADAAAWLSGEENAGSEAAQLLVSEDREIMKKWNDLKNTDNEVIDVDKAWGRLNSMIETESPVILLQKTTILRTFARIAAMVIIVTGIGWLLFGVIAPKELTATATADQKNVEILLADGSKVYLNRNSRLNYPKEFRSNSRMVSLRGEAFFDIAPDAERPFIIDAGKAKVRVSGTSFNVITDNSSNEVEVYVSTGSVILISNDKSQSLTLEPEFVGRVSDAGASQSLNTNVNYLAWHTDMLVYDGERLEVVFSDLKRTFNIDIKAADPAINDYRLTSPFERQPHDTIIKLICTTFNLHSVGEEGTYILYPGQAQ